MAGADASAAVPPRRLRANFSWSLAGNLGYAASQWLIIVFLTRASSPDVVGRFALALAIVTPVLTFTSLQLRVILATDARGEFQFGTYLSLRSFCTVAALGLVAAIAFASGYSREVWLATMAMALSRGADAFCDIMQGKMQRHERLDQLALSLAMRGILQLGFFAATWLATGSLVSSILATAAASVLVLLVHDTPRVRALGAMTAPPGGGIRPLLHLAWLGLPIGLVTTANSLSGNIPRYFIAGSVGETELGIFAALYYLTVAGSMVMGALSDSSSPRLAQLFLSGDYGGYQRLLTRLVLLAIGIGLAAFMVSVVIGEPLLRLFYGPAYAAQSTTFLWIMAASAPLYVASILGGGINAMRRFHAQVPLPVVNLLLTAGLAAVLIPRNGLEGAGQVILLTAVLSMLTTGGLLAGLFRHYRT